MYRAISLTTAMLTAFCCGFAIMAAVKWGNWADALSALLLAAAALVVSIIALERALFPHDYPTPRNRISRTPRA